MGLESASYPNQLVATNPTGSDAKSTADDHIRLLKSVIQTTFPNLTGAMTAAQADLNKVGVTQSQTSNDTSVSSTAFVQTAVAAAISAIGAGAALWVSGTTYALGNLAWSPTNYQTYRRIIAGAGTTDPASDATNWVLVTGNVQTTATQTLTNKTLTAPAINGFTGDTSAINIGSGQIVKDTAGKFGINVSPAYRLHVSESSTSTYTARFDNTHSSQPYGLSLLFSGASPNNTTNTFLICSDSTTDRLRIYSNGNVVNTLNSYGAISDPDLKTNITLAKSQWDDVKQLARNVVKYNLKDNPHGFKLLGFISRDNDGITGVRSISPGLVQAMPEIEEYEVEPATEAQAEILDDEVNVLSPSIEAKPAVMGRRETGKSTDSVQYSIAYMKAFKALGEALERIEALEAKVSALEARA